MPRKITAQSRDQRISTTDFTDGPERLRRSSTYVCGSDVVAMVWSEGGVAPKILALTTYLGHRSARETYWYLSAVPELLALGSARLAAIFEGGIDV